MTSPRTILTAWNMHAKKQYGQNFLADPSVTEMIVERAGITSDSIVLEIGAGLGALTIPAARRAGKVYAVEKDRQLLPLLKNELIAAGVDSKVDVISKDILKVDLNDISEKHQKKITVMGNLPYNISSQILIWIVKARKLTDRAVFMFQKELAERIASPPGTREYGRISAVVQYCGEIRSIATIDARMFFPRPKVDSEVIEIRLHEQPEFPADNEELLFGVIKAAFGKRRKNLKNSLTKSELGIDPDLILKALEISEIDYHRRAETLSVEEFVRLSNSLNRMLF